MRPLDLPGMVPFGKPKDWDDAKDGRCNTLPVMKTADVHLSVWELNDDERRRIAAGENLTLTCVGVQPPVLLKVAPIREPLDIDGPEAQAALARVERVKWPKRLTQSLFSAIAKARKPITRH